MAFQREESLLRRSCTALLGFGQLWGSFHGIAGLRDDPELSADLGLREAAVFRSCADDAMRDELSFRRYRATQVPRYGLVGLVITEDDDPAGAQCGACTPLASLPHARHVVELLSGSSHDTSANTLAVYQTEELANASLPLVLAGD